jgi:hypothetical protein
MVSTLRFDKAVAAHSVSVTESLRLKQATGDSFFKMSSSYACRRAKACSWRNLAAVAGATSAPRAAATGVEASFCHLSIRLESIF